MEDEDAEMAKAIAKSEQEEEQRLQSELRRAGEGGRGGKMEHSIGVCVCLHGSHTCL